MHVPHDVPAAPLPSASSVTPASVSESPRHGGTARAWVRTRVQRGSVERRSQTVAEEGDGTEEVAVEGRGRIVFRSPLTSFPQHTPFHLVAEGETDGSSGGRGSVRPGGDREAGRDGQTAEHGSALSAKNPFCSRTLMGCFIPFYATKQPTSGLSMWQVACCFLLLLTCALPDDVMLSHRILT